MYRDAKAVLVLDKHLQQVGQSPIERAFQILGCEWMTRLWTLQEGRLARNLIFRFRGANASLWDILNHDFGLNDRDIFTNLGVSVDIMLTPLFVESTNISQRFAHLTENLQYRKTTVASDEPICLATLLGLYPE